MKPQGATCKATAAAVYPLGYISTFQKESRNSQDLGVHLVSVCNNLGYVAFSYALVGSNWVGDHLRRRGGRRCTVALRGVEPGTTLFVLFDSPY